VLRSFDPATSKQISGTQLRGFTYDFAFGWVLREKSGASEAESEPAVPSGVVPSISRLCNTCAELPEDLLVGGGRWGGVVVR